MAVRILPRTRARHAPLVVETLPSAVLMLALGPPGVDLLGYVLLASSLAALALVAAIGAATALTLMWLRYPRTSWLAAAVLAAVASVTMRLVGADIAPLLSLLSVLAIGIGGGFASPTHELAAWLENQPSVARR